MQYRRRRRNNNLNRTKTRLIRIDVTGDKASTFDCKNIEMAEGLHMISTICRRNRKDRVNGAEQCSNSFVGRPQSELTTAQKEKTKGHVQGHLLAVGCVAVAHMEFDHRAKFSEKRKISRPRHDHACGDSNCASTGENRCCRDFESKSRGWLRMDVLVKLPKAI